MARFKAKGVEIGGGLARPELGPRRGSHAAAAPPRRDGARAGHRVREHRQPAARARRRARQRDGHPAVARGEPAAAHLAAARRVVPARGAWRCGRHARRPLDDRLHHLDSARRRGGDASLGHGHRTALLFAAGLTLGTGLLFGLFPALHSTRPDSGLDAQGPGGPAVGRAAQPSGSARRSPPPRSRCR